MNPVPHTPGPWVAKGDFDHVREDYREDRCIVTADFDEDTNTGFIIGVLRGHGAQLKANARLITNAPALLAACEAMLATALKVGDKAWASAIEHAGTNRPCDMAMAAIQAAKGETK